MRMDVAPELVPVKMLSCALAGGTKRAASARSRTARMDRDRTKCGRMIEGVLSMLSMVDGSNESLVVIGETGGVFLEGESTLLRAGNECFGECDGGLGPRSWGFVQLRG